MAFSTQRKVRFGETDPAGIVYFSRFYEYAHEAFEDMLEAGGFAIDRFFESEYGMPLVHSEANYKIPSKLGDLLRLDLEVDKIGNRSFRYSVGIHGEDGALRATVVMTHAIIDLQTRTTRGVPDQLLDVLRRSGALS
jgi:YbgC/YbaW family acyl-CoA thioester hydrolase